MFKCLIRLPISRSGTTNRRPIGEARIEVPKFITELYDDLLHKSLFYVYSYSRKTCFDSFLLIFYKGIFHGFVRQMR